MGGGGDSETETRPLGSSPEARSFQEMFPLSEFAAPNPMGVAGISPLQQAVLQMLPALTRSPAGLSQLLALGPPVAQIAAGAAEPTSGAQSALRSLSPRLGGITPLPSISPQLRSLAAMLESLQQTQNVFGLTPEQMMALQGATTDQTVPVIGGFGRSATPARTATPRLPTRASEWITVPGRGGWVTVRNS